MFLNEKIAILARQALLSESQFLVDAIVSTKQGPKKVTVIMDGDQGTTIDDCAKVSRVLLKALEEDEEFREGFTLEVTTPGLDRPLKLKRQFTKNIGRSLKVQLKDKTVENGKLVEVREEAIALEQEIQEGKKKELKRTPLLFSEIDKAIVQISFK